MSLLKSLMFNDSKKALQDNKSLSRVPVDINTWKKAGRKYFDRLADSCKRSSANRMAVGSRQS